MEPQNYLNFEKSFLDKAVYRYMKLDKFYKLFDERENVLSHPGKWDDPFENFILNARIKSGDGKLQDFGFRDHVYGQCWTVERRSDALWQIFCGKAQGVRIRTTLRKLGATFSLRLSHDERQHAFIGKLEYLSDKKLFGKGRSIFMNRDPESIARSLLMKRNAFRHEAEVRLVYRMTTGTPAKNGLFPYPVDPHALIDQVMIDPRFQPAEALKLRLRIVERTGYRKAKILYSLLYSQPKDFFVDTVGPDGISSGLSPQSCSGANIDSK